MNSKMMNAAMYLLNKPRRSDFQEIEDPYRFFSCKQGFLHILPINNTRWVLVSSSFTGNKIYEEIQDKVFIFDPFDPNIL